jgi:predicted aminopeptidase
MKLRTLLFLLACLPWVCGCETLSYYSQAIRGQLGVMGAARPVGDWLADPATPAELRGRLETAKRIREFASQHLALPQNGSYSSYADLGRPYVVWNVYAAPRFAVEPKQECFPFTGCVSYRGFFSEEDARRHAARLREQGYDVYLGGVPAYSTLGWFDDPLLSTFIQYPDVQLARLVFHELAHQRVYAKGDTTFNESFAVTVEEEGVKRWLEAQGRGGELEALRAGRLRRQEFALRVAQTRERLALVYREKNSEEKMQERKREEWEKLRRDYSGFVPAEPNNAYLVSIALYTQLVPEFERLLAACSSDLAEFYRRAEALAGEGRAARAALTSAGCRRTS